MPQMLAAPRTAPYAHVGPSTAAGPAQHVVLQSAEIMLLTEGMMMLVCLAVCRLHLSTLSMQHAAALSDCLPIVGRTPRSGLCTGHGL